MDTNRIGTKHPTYKTEQGICTCDMSWTHHTNRNNFERSLWSVKGCAIFHQKPERDQVVPASHQNPSSLTPVQRPQGSFEPSAMGIAAGHYVKKACQSSKSTFFVWQLKQKASPHLNNTLFYVRNTFFFLIKTRFACIVTYNKPLCHSV